MKRVLTAIILPIVLLGEITEQVENSTELINQSNIHEIQKRESKSTISFSSNYYKDPKYQHYIYQDLATLFGYDKQNVRLNIALGIKAIEAQRYEDALAAFERVLIYEPNSYIAQFESARIYFYLKSYNHATILLNELQKRDDLTEEMYSQIASQLELINLEKSRTSLNFAIILGVDWDDNVTYLSTNKLSGFSHIEAVLLNFNYKFTPDLMIKNPLLGYAKSYFTIQNSNLLMYTYTPTLNYMIDNLSINVGLYFDQVIYGPSYNISSYGIYPTIDIYISKNITLIPSLKNLIKNDILGSSMSSTYSEYNLDSAFIFENSKLQSSITYAKEKATQNYTSLNKNQFKYNLSYGTTFNTILSTQLSGAYKFIDYLSRDDNQFLASFDLNLNIPKLFLLKTTLQNISNISTTSSSTYYKNSVVFNIIKGF